MAHPKIGFILELMKYVYSIYKHYCNALLFEEYDY